MTVFDGDFLEKEIAANFKLYIYIYIIDRWHNLLIGCLSIYLWYQTRWVKPALYGSMFMSQVIWYFITNEMDSVLASAV